MDKSIIFPHTSQEHSNINEEDIDKYAIWQVHAYVSVICFPFILLLDGLLIASIIVFRRYHNTHTMFIQGQVISDVLFSVYSFALGAPNLVGVFDDYHEETNCMLFWTGFTCLEQIGLYMYTAITIDRYIAIHYPFWYHEHMRVSSAVKIVFGMFVFSSVVAVIVIPWASTDEECDYYRTYPYAYKVALFVEYNALPVVPFIMNIIIFKTSKKKLMSGSKKWSHLWTKEKRQCHIEREHSLNVSVVMYGAFMLCWVPVNVLSPIGDAYQHNRIIRNTLRIVYIWYSLYPFLNAAAILATKRSLFKAFRLLLTTPPWKWTLLKHTLGEADCSQDPSDPPPAMKSKAQCNVTVAWSSVCQVWPMKSGTRLSASSSSSAGIKPPRDSRNATVSFLMENVRLAIHKASDRSMSPSSQHTRSVSRTESCC